MSSSSIYTSKAKKQSEKEENSFSAVVKPFLSGRVHKKIGTEQLFRSINS